MRRAQIVVYEADDRLAEVLRPRAQDQGWWLREVRHAGSALETLGPGAGAVFVLRVGRDLERELSLLEQVSWLYPKTATVVVGDVDSTPLGDLAWDLGASLVLLPPLTWAHLPDIVAGLLGAADAEGPPATEPAR